MERKKFGEIPIGAYYKLPAGGGTYKKLSFDSALHMYEKKIIEVAVYEEIKVAKNPTFILNY
jgi:hypothetical protein